jgi:hypothetical protein
METLTRPGEHAPTNPPAVAFSSVMGICGLGLSWRAAGTGVQALCSRVQPCNGDECWPARSGRRSVSMPSRRETDYLAEWQVYEKGVNDNS